MLRDRSPRNVSISCTVASNGKPRIRIQSLWLPLVIMCCGIVAGTEGIVGTPAKPWIAMDDVTFHYIDYYIWQVEVIAKI